MRDEVAKTSQAATARATGLTLRGVQNYLKGIGEPTQSSLEKLSAYFNVSVAWLRGGSAIELLGKSIEGLPEEARIEKILDLNMMETVIDVEVGKSKYPDLWEAFTSIPEEKREEALKVLEGYRDLTVAALALFNERNKP